ncbi:hypothetical protein N7532_011583 [Penicillium argentinense]|uniref:Uncharacterized protein n=1 Tax=Penicillium argentinense TaxID=1131581 RepID=A0A9W9EIW4_9EURO|nr:uncharacterized protein N7532_011583 [Penicillium argentinense]KAJ5082540.1 hypothetical protein N7532_011583 [Penicillium argentinense]
MSESVFFHLLSFSVSRPDPILVQFIASRLGSPLSFLYPRIPLPLSGDRPLPAVTCKRSARSTPEVVTTASEDENRAVATAPPKRLRHEESRRSSQGKLNLVMGGTVNSTPAQPWTRKVGSEKSKHAAALEALRRRRARVNNGSDASQEEGADANPEDVEDVDYRGTNLDK